MKERNFEWVFNRSIYCTSWKNIIYMIECNKESCKQRHISETEVDLKTLISQHQGSIYTKKLDPPTKKQFNQPGHSKHNLKATVLEKI